MYARVTHIQLPSGLRAEVVSAAQGLAPILKQQGFNGLQVLTAPNVGEGIIVSSWETEVNAGS
jgi:heme-degrading monooxygenase HmoA